MIYPPPPLRMAGIAVRVPRKAPLGMNIKLAFPNFHCDVLDLAGKRDTSIVEQDIQPSLHRHHRFDYRGRVLF